MPYFVRRQPRSEPGRCETDCHTGQRFEVVDDLSCRRACSAAVIPANTSCGHCRRTNAVGVVENDVQGVAFCSSLSSLASVSPFLPLRPFPSLAHFLRGSSGCSPHSPTVSRRLQVWSVLDSDPPRVVPPCHVSVRHVALFVH